VSAFALRRITPTSLLSSSAIGMTLAALAFPVIAQETGSTPSSGPIALPTLSVEGSGSSDYKADQPTLPKLTGPLLDTPQSISVVTQQVMQDQGVINLRDALRNVPGISLAAGEFGAQGDNLTIRGFSARNDIFIDGMRDFGGYYRDPFYLEEVEVLEGPSSMLFGRGSTGGVVNQDSKTPQLQNFMHGQLSFGTDDTERLTADINQALPEWGEGVAARLNLMATHAGVADRPETENQRFGVAPSLAFGLGTPTRITLNFIHQTEYDHPDYGLPVLFSQATVVNGQGAGQVAPVARDSYYGFDRGDFLRTNVDIATAKIEHDFSDDLQIRDQARYSHYVRSFRITEPQIAGVAGQTVPYAFPFLVSPGTPLSSLLVARNQLYGTSLETLADNQLDLTAHFNNAFGLNTLVAGLEITRETSDPRRFSTVSPYSLTPLTNPNPGDTYNATTYYASKTRTTSWSQAVYLVDTIDLSDQWQLIAGGRFDRFATDYDQDVYKAPPSPPNTLTLPTTALQHIDRMPSWRAGIVYKPAPNGSIYFDAGTSFNPSAESLSLSVGNGSLDPVKNTTYEVGTKWDVLNRNLSLTAALYQTQQTNVRETIPNEILQQLVGDAIARGFTAEVKGHITPEWQVIGGYAYTYSVIDESPIGDLGHRLANVPAHTVNLFTTYTFPFGLEIGGGMNFVSGRYLSTTPRVVGNVNFFTEAPGYVTGNLMAKYTVNEHLDLQVNIQNVSDAYYYDLLHPSHIVPGAGVGALFAASVKY